MKLLTKEVERNLPALYSQEKNPDPECKVKFFHPMSDWKWFAYEGSWVCNECGAYDCKDAEHEKAGKDFMFFGFIHGHEDELGYFSLSQMESVKGPLGLKIERDMHWSPKKLSVIRAGNYY